jgi:probable addiction module antidote protein
MGTSELIWSFVIQTVSGIIAVFIGIWLALVVERKRPAGRRRRERSARDGRVRPRVRLHRQQRDQEHRRGQALLRLIGTPRCPQMLHADLETAVWYASQSQFTQLCRNVDERVIFSQFFDDVRRLQAFVDFRTNLHVSLLQQRRDMEEFDVQVLTGDVDKHLAALAEDLRFCGVLLVTDPWEAGAQAVDGDQYRDGVRSCSRSALRNCPEWVCRIDPAVNCASQSVYDQDREDRSFRSVVPQAAGPGRPGPDRGAHPSARTRKSWSAQGAAGRDRRTQGRLRARLSRVLHAPKRAGHPASMRWRKEFAAKGHPNGAHAGGRIGRMSVKTRTSPWDSAEYLTTEEHRLGLLLACLEEAPEDAALFTHAVGIVARSRNMSQIARDTGLTREGLYKALTEFGNPNFATVWRCSRHWAIV